MSSQRPVPVTSFDQMRSDLDEWGYCLMADALSTAEVEEIKTRLLDQAEAERSTGVALRDGGPMPWQKDLPQRAPNQRVMNLLDKGEEFWQLLLHPIVDEVICHLLGENVISSSVTANITHPGSQPMPLHSDQGYVDVPITDAVVCNTMWMLSDYTAENGGTYLIPKSHLRNQIPDKPFDFTECISLEGPTGTACVFDGRVWHGTGPNTSKDDSRVGLLNYWCRPWLRQQENMAVSFSDETIAAMPEALLKRTGFLVHGTLGNIDPNPSIARPEGLIDRSQERIGRRSASEA
ncbi:MAG: hypothetical protein CMQ05_02220 [Gammaproteobacteria bacterium]|uniref:Phytanoyl-CoA dioxygenase n=1 Tax=OM182 bacterium MED-G24 TaxID=1986255 RepID=A0A2A5WPL1_9GAMM|nr:hypothetical protein [Gammaproteobacteria bacterium]PDH38361.1 MAG: hypothetical protein CNE99_07005 [OM182 bacterium MED-G24]RPG26687.1 MAG: hypothetical protein CBC10_003980 [Gammaproteobacteria bacterium TMED50]